MLVTSNSHSNNCCVCLCKSPNLQSVNTSKTEDTENWLTKLRKCVAEIDWCDVYLLCQACSNQLDFVYNFRLLCFESNSRRHLIYSSTDYKCESVLRDSYENENTTVDNSNSSIKHELQSKTESRVFSCDKRRASFENEAELDAHSKESHGGEYSFEDDNFVDSGSMSNTDSNLEDSDSESDVCTANLGQTGRRRQISNVKKVRAGSTVEDNSETRVSKIEYLDLKCCVCEIVFDTVSKLVKHSVTEHSMEKKEVKPYACPKCPWRFRIPYSLRDHIKYHDNIRNEVCTYCGKGFVTKAALTTHEKQHLNLREYQCPHCPKSFNTHKDIRTHKYVVHTDPGKWKHVCPVCSKRFPVKSNFDAHVRRHNNEKPYGCHLCDAKFCVPSSLRIHVQSHSNVRDHKCSECGNEYKNIKYLQQHMNKKHNIGDAKIPVKVKKYVCSMCPKRFDARNKLTRHLCTHTGERPFPCSVCDKRFTDKSYVTQHMKTVHNYVPENRRSVSVS